MRAAGVETLYDLEALNAVGLVEVLTKIPSGIRLAHRLVREALRRGTRVVVCIDAPVFNLFLARQAKRAGLRVIYYISPQIWAWRRGRSAKIARRVDTMLTLFPFEVPLYAAAGIHAAYVGHPVVDRVGVIPPAAQVRQLLGLDPTRPVVALLPGSRRHEIRRLLPLMLQALQRIQTRVPDIHGVLPLAPTVAYREIQPWLAGVDVPLTIVEGRSLEVLRAAQVALVASGTATLEAGLLGTPMVVMYKVHAVTALCARLLLRVPYIGLVNIVAGKEVVPELLQHQVQPAAIAAHALRWLHEPAARQRVTRELARLHEIMGPAGGAQRAAEHVLRCLTEGVGMSVSSGTP
jgi:lipid-A-disaccharide synthase